MFSSTEAVDRALVEGGGKVEVWRIDGSAKTLVPKGDIGKFYSGDCYIVLYTYHLGEKKEYYLCCWIGEDCNEDDPNMAAQLASSISNSCKGRPVQVCINQGKEPPQFVAIFQLIVVLKGGLSSGYKKFVTDNGVNDETYTAECVALIRISETAVRNNTAVQVDAVATSLNSNECFFLQSGSSIFTWHGNQSTHERQQLAAEVAELLKVNNPNLIKDMLYEIDHNLLGDYAVTLQMTKFVRVEDTVTFLGRRYTKDDLSMAGMKDGLSFFVKEEFLPEIVGSS